MNCKPDISSPPTGESLRFKNGVDFNISDLTGTADTLSLHDNAVAGGVNVFVWIFVNFMMRQCARMAAHDKNVTNKRCCDWVVVIEAVARCLGQNIDRQSDTESFV